MVDSKERDKIFKEYQEITNLSCSDLKIWKKDPCSKSASLSSAPLERNINLKCKVKSKWGKKEIKDAKRTISFISRMKKNKCGQPRFIKGKNCGCGRDVSLKNWAFDPKK